MTMRSHDQYNTTIYNLHDRYRGIKGERMVVFLNPEDMAEQHIAEDDRLRLVAYTPTVNAVSVVFAQFPMKFPKAAQPPTFGKQTP